MSRKYYALVIEDQWQKPQRLANGDPHNFVVVSFPNIQSRIMARNHTWAEGFRMIAVKRNSLYTQDLPCLYFDDLLAYGVALKYEFDYSKLVEVFCNTEHVSIHMQRAVEAMQKVWRAKGWIE